MLALLLSHELLEFLRLLELLDLILSVLESLFLELLGGDLVDSAIVVSEVA